MLLDVPAAELQHRLDRRKGHFVGSNLLASQLDSLEVEGDLTSVNADRPPAQVATDIVTLVRATRSRTTS
jgi:gluconate kinase